MSQNHQLTTFSLGGNLFGIEVMKVQEVTGEPTVVQVPLSPHFVSGLVNLRGQIATAIGLRELLGFQAKAGDCQNSVVCKIENNLVSLLVDTIGDVVEVDHSQFESSPETLPIEIKRYVKGVYKLDGSLLCLLDLEQLAKELSGATAQSA
jgi:purine-binding chemotaxis protein CheW